MCVYTCACEGQRSTLGVFLNHSLPYAFIQGLPMNLDFTNLARLADRKPTPTHRPFTATATTTAQV